MSEFYYYLPYGHYILHVMKDLQMLTETLIVQFLFMGTLENWNNDRNNQDRYKISQNMMFMKNYKVLRFNFHKRIETSLLCFILLSSLKVNSFSSQSINLKHFNLFWKNIDRSYTNSHTLGPNINQFHFIVCRLILW